MIKDIKEILYLGVGILERTDEVTDPQAINLAAITNNGDLVVQYVDGSQESFPVEQGSIEPYTFGIVLFSTDDGEQYAIREVTDLDGTWVSKYKIELPPITIKDLLEKPEVDFQMPYLENENEKLIAVKSPNDDNIISVMYLNNYGAYARINGMWVSVSPTDTTLEGTIPFNVKPETAQEFMDLYDNGDVTYDESKDFLESVE